MSYELDVKRDKSGKFLKGHVRPKDWVEKHRSKMVGEKNPFWKKKHIVETIRKIKEARSKQDMSWRIGIPASKESIEKNRKAHIGKNSGEMSHFWKGGVTPFRLFLRQCFKYRQWVSDVFTRDDFVCQECGIRGGNLHAHHVKEFSRILDENKITNLDLALNCSELWNINNGLTLCVSCHRKTFRLNQYEK